MQTTSTSIKIHSKILFKRNRLITNIQYGDKLFSFTMKLTALLYYLIAVVTADQCIVTEFDQVSEAIENCKDIIISDLQVPGGEQLSLHLTEGTTLTFRGTTTFGHHEWTGPLVSLTGINVTVKGEKGTTSNVLEFGTDSLIFFIAQ